MRVAVCALFYFSVTIALQLNPFNFVKNSIMEEEKYSSLIQALKSIDNSAFNIKFAPEDEHKYTSCLQKVDVKLNISQLLDKYHYPVEEHQVETSDGYLLTLIRIPCRCCNQCPVIFLMHGLLSSADDFVTMGPENGIAYLLSSECYDVWLGNARGNKHSRNHVSLSPDKDKKFWDFSWHEIGIHDLPAMIDYILLKTNQDQLVYVGHSQGTTAFFVMCSEIPEYNHKVSFMVSLSAVAWVSNAKSPLARTMALLVDDIKLISELIGYYELLPSDIFLRTLASILCGTPGLALIICSTFTMTLTGFDYKQLNVSSLPVIFGHIPSGSATKQLLHYLQEVNSGHFRQYDHGVKRNIEVYGSKTPPPYEVEKITAPIAIFYADNDWLSNYIDVKTLMSKLPNVVEVYHVPYKYFNHFDYVWAKDLKKLVYGKLSELIKKYSVTT